MDALSYSLQILNEIFLGHQRESWEQQQVDEAQAHYESSVVEEARAIVAGRSKNPPAKEHLRVLLEWLDGASFQFNQGQQEVGPGSDTPPF